MSEEYRTLFLAEARDLIDRFERMLIQLESGDRSALKEIYRILHTIKGSAGVMGYQPITDLVHQSEEIVKSAQENKAGIDNRTIIDLYESLDFLKKAIRSIERGEPIPTGRVVALRIEIEETPFAAARASVILNNCQKLGIITHSSPDQDEIISGWTGVKIDVEIQTKLPESEAISFIQSVPEVISVIPYEPGISIPEVKISVENLDRILALVSELSRNMTNLGSMLNLSSKPGLIDTNDAISTNLTRLRDEVLGLRLVPLSTLFRQFPTWFRNEALKLDKKADLVIQGGEIEVDRSIIEYLREPIIHILRNALVHGIEPEAERKKKGLGLVNLEAIKEGDDLILVVSDNGRGINPQKVKRTALKLGLLDKEQAERLPSGKLLSLLTDPRFTTLKIATSLGGRGVGLDVVQKKMDEIGGNLKISSKPGQGSTFMLTIPLSLAIVRSMVTIIGNSRFAVPFSILKDTMKQRPDDARSLLGQRYLFNDENLIPLLDLATFLGLSRNGDLGDVIIAEIDDHEYGFQIDKLEKPIDLLVRPLPKELGPYIGASIHPDGMPILHIDLRQIIKGLNR